MDQNKKIGIVAALIALATVVLTIAVANAYYASTNAANPYGTYNNYGPHDYEDSYTGAGPAAGYGSYGSSYHNYNQLGGRMGGMEIGRMGGSGTGMWMP